MRAIDIHSTFMEYDSMEELAEADQKLMKEAKLSMSDAYAPYSRFYVGAAVLLENGITVKGNNQENASYPLGLCAERVALFAAGANYPGIKIKAIAVTARSDQFVIDTPVSPCGACRQAVAEYEHRYRNQVRLILGGEKGKILVAEGISNFLPLLFNGDDLKKK